MAEKESENQYCRWISFRSAPNTYFMCPHCGAIWDVQPWIVKQLNERPIICGRCGNEILGIERRD